MAVNVNPNVADRSNTAFFTGPIATLQDGVDGDGSPATVLTGPIFVDLAFLPAIDPGVLGQLWLNAGALSVSAG